MGTFFVYLRVETIFPSIILAFNNRSPVKGTRVKYLIRQLRQGEYKIRQEHLLAESKKML